MRYSLKRTAVRTAMAQPWLVRLAGRGRQSGRDAALDRQLAAALEFERIARLPSLATMEPEAARQFAVRGMSPLDLDPAPMAEVVDASVVVDSEEVTVATIPVRIYVPHDASPNWIVYFHGGGGVIGSIDSSESTARHLAATTGCTVASVGYRLGPEYKHPTAIDDAIAAWQALVPRVPAGGRVAVAGDSFGGFLSVHVDARARAAGGRPPDLQVLIYPIVDLTLTSPSIERLSDGYLLTREVMHWFRDHYLHADDDPRDGSPWFWEDLADACPAIVVTAGFDPLVDEGDAWAERLRGAGVTVRHRHYPSLVHGFVSLAGAIDAARHAFDQVCGDVADMLAE